MADLLESQDGTYRDLTLRNQFQLRSEIHIFYCSASKRLDFSIVHFSSVQFSLPFFHTYRSPQYVTKYQYELSTSYNSNYNRLTDLNQCYQMPHLLLPFILCQRSGFMSTTEGKESFKNFISVFNLLKPSGHVMHQQFNIQQLQALPTLYLFCIYL